MQRRQLALTMLAVFLVGAVLLQGQPTSIAQRNGDIGIIDLERIWGTNILPALDAPLKSETARLQAELDAAVRGKSEAEKQQLFDAYQVRLYSLQQEIVDQLLEDVRRAIGEVAGDLGISVVLDVNSVMFGGIDVTDLVLDRLDSKG